ncbi:MAG: hypothetical protein U0325_09425 [Polyangiales bacterium]
MTLPRAAWALALLLGGAEARAWGWTQPRGAHYLRVWARGLVGARGYLADGQIEPLGTSFVDVALHGYLEYGLTDDWTFVAQGRPVGWAQVGGDATGYTGELQVGLRRALLRGGWNVAAEVRYGLTPPWGDRALGAGVVRGAAWVYRPTVETQAFVGELQFGHGLGRLGWITSYVGVRSPTRPGLEASVHAGVQGGVRFGFGLMLAASVLTNVPLHGFTDSNVSGAGNTRYVGWALDVAYAITPRWSLSVGVGGALLAASNAGALPVLVGFEHRAP